MSFSVKYLMLTVFTGILSVIIGSIILPGITSYDIEGLVVTDATMWVFWLVILFQFVFLIIIIALIGRNERDIGVSDLLKALGKSFVYSIIIITFGCQFYLFLVHPELFDGVNIQTKYLKIFAYPAVIALTIEDMQPVWIGSTVFFIVSINIAITRVRGERNG